MEFSKKSYFFEIKKSFLAGARSDGQTHGPLRADWQRTGDQNLQQYAPGHDDDRGRRGDESRNKVGH